MAHPTTLNHIKHLFGLHNTFSLQHLHIIHHLLAYVFTVLNLPICLFYSLQK